MAEFDNAELLDDIRERGGIPSQDVRFTDAKLLAAASLELRDAIAPLLVKTQTERGVYLANLTVTAGVAEYRLPSRALGARFKSVGWLQTGNTTYVRLRHLSADSYYLQSTAEQGNPYGFFLRDNVLVLVPTPNVTGTLRVPYYLRPATLTAVAAAGVVNAVDVGTATVTLDSVPAAFATGARYDVVRGVPGFEALVLSDVGTLGGVTDVIFSTADLLAAGVAVGDYVCLSGTAPVAQCPVEVRGLLAVRAARRAMKTGDDGNQAAMLDADVAELTEIALDLLTPRADAEPQEFGDARRGLLWGVVV